MPDDRAVDGVVDNRVVVRGWGRARPLEQIVQAVVVDLQVRDLRAREDEGDGRTGAPTPRAWSRTESE